MKIMTAKIAAALSWLFLLTGTAAYADQSPEQFYTAFRTFDTLEAGRSYIIETSNLKWRDSLQGYPAATYLLVFSQDGNDDRGTLVAQGGARNGSLESRVHFTPAVTGTYRIVVASNNTVMDALPEFPGSTLQCGNADLSVSYVSGSAEVRQQYLTGISFCGMGHYIEYHAGECFRANASASNVHPFIYFIPAASQQTPIATGSPIRWANDTSSDNASLCFEEEGSGWILSTAGTYEGPGTVDLVEHTRVHTADSQNLDEYTPVAATSLIRAAVILEGGRANVVETAHLGKRDIFQGTNPDTVLHLIDMQTRTVVARNDDVNTSEDRSRVVFTPPQSGIYEVIVRAKNRTTPGRADLYVNGFRLLAGQHFAGEMLRPLLKAGLINGRQDCVATKRLSGDPFFVWLLSSSSSADPGVGARVVEDNDDGAGVNARVCFSDFSTHFPSSETARGMLILGSASNATEGVTTFDIDGSNHY